MTFTHKVNWPSSDVVLQVQTKNSQQNKNISTTTVSIATKLGRVVTYHELPFDHVVLQDDMIKSPLPQCL